jgi:serine/threonine protein kinase
MPAMSGVNKTTIFTELQVNSLILYFFIHNRGTSVYMAPEILIKSCRLEVASFENLQKVDIWAFGMVLFNLVNPNLKYPF